jgi:hypothetical protein
MCASRRSSAGAYNILVSTAPLTPRPKSSFHLKVGPRVLVQNDYRGLAAARPRGIGRCIDSHSLQFRRELGLQQCSDAEHACKLEPLRDQRQHTIRAEAEYQKRLIKEVRHELCLLLYYTVLNDLVDFLPGRSSLSGLRCGHRQ